MCVCVCLSVCVSVCVRINVCVCGVRGGRDLGGGGTDARMLCIRLNGLTQETSFI